MMEVLTRSEFVDWYNHFHSKWSGDFIKPDRWFDEVEEKHQEIRERLGGIRKIIKVPLEDAQLPLSWEDAREIISKFINQYSTYLSSYSFTVEMMLHPKIPSGKHKGAKWTKHILHWAKKMANSSPELEKMMGNLGELHAKCKTVKNILYVNMTTDPRAFAQIGHYGPDVGSCFRQKRENQFHKYLLGSYPNSYVLLVTRSSQIENFVEDSECERSDTICRAWGAASPEHKFNLYHLSNYYLGKNAVNIEGNILKSIEKLYTDLLEEIPSKYENLFKINHVYQNKSFNYSYGKPKLFKSSPQPQSIVLYMEPKGFLAEFKLCPRCNKKFFFEKDSCLRDRDSYYCEKCTSLFPTCEWTNKKVAGDLVPAFNRENKRININCSLIRDGTFLICHLSERYYHCNDMVASISGGFISKFSVETFNYHKCNNCNKFFSKHDNKNDFCKYCSAVVKEL